MASPNILSRLLPGVLIAAIVAVAAQFLSEHYGAPAMLMALLLGIALNFLSEEERSADGIRFAGSTLLRIGVALLGVRVSVELLSQLSVAVVVLILAGMFATILFGLLAARLLGRGWRLAILSGGAVAVCGVSAAMAIASVLPKNEHSERNLIFTVVGVTVLSTFAMIAYPPIAQFAGLDFQQIGIFLGGTIHDVAQVVGAGFSISDETGEVATVVKIIRVSMLAPIVLLLAIVVRSQMEGDTASAKRPPLIPPFVLGFLVLAVANSIGFIPAAIAAVANDVSRWFLIIAIAAVGMKTSLKSILEVGGQAITLIVAETVFLAVVIVLGIKFLV
ncbi:MAG: YeiH family protein [Pseudomonadota bacterium]